VPAPHPCSRAPAAAPDLFQPPRAAWPLLTGGHGRWPAVGRQRLQSACLSRASAICHPYLLAFTFASPRSHPHSSSTCIAALPCPSTGAVHRHRGFFLRFDPLAPPPSPAHPCHATAVPRIFLLCVCLAAGNTSVLSRGRGPRRR
jgi:hypothetical protein